MTQSANRQHDYVQNDGFADVQQVPKTIFTLAEVLLIDMILPTQAAGSVSLPLCTSQNSFACKQQHVATHNTVHRVTQMFAKQDMLP